MISTYTKSNSKKLIKTNEVPNWTPVENVGEIKEKLTLIIGNTMRKKKEGAYNSHFPPKSQMEAGLFTNISFYHI